MTVAELLTASIAAHLRYREAKASKPPRPVDARAALVEADSLRRRAQDLDPRQTDPVWASSASTHPHAALLTFYAEQLAK
jgi:hypothetical protein